MAELWRKRKASAKGICCQPAHTHGALSCTLMSSQTLKFRETLNSSDTLMPGWRQGEGSSIRIEAAAAGDGLSVVAEVSHEERQVLRLVDGERTVEQINDHANMGEFDTYRLLADLVTRKLVEEVKRPNVAEVKKSGRKLPEKVLHVLIGFMLAAFAAADTPPIPFAISARMWA